MKNRHSLIFLYSAMVVLAILGQGYLCASGHSSVDVETTLPLLESSVAAFEHDMVLFVMEWFKMIVHYLF